VLFGAQPNELIPKKYSHIEEEVMRNAASLLQEVANDSSLRAARKRELLSAALQRAITSPNREGV
jgi:hypothetical protein